MSKYDDPFPCPHCMRMIRFRDADRVSCDNADAGGAGSSVESAGKTHGCHLEVEHARMTQRRYARERLGNAKIVPSEHDDLIRESRDAADRIEHMRDGSLTRTILISLLRRLADALAAVRDECRSAEESCDALHAKIASLSPHQTCACSYDRKDDVCSHHSPQLAAALAARQQDTAHLNLVEAALSEGTRSIRYVKLGEYSLSFDPANGWCAWPARRWW